MAPWYKKALFPASHSAEAPNFRRRAPLLTMTKGNDV